jgi:four helix bundle protein
MSRDYTKLRTFHYADDLAMAVYQATRAFPREEMFSLVSQMRRAALSIPANIVEGAQRSSEAEYLNFLNIALGSAGELGYYIHFAEKMGFLNAQQATELRNTHEICIKSLQALVSSLQKVSNSRKTFETPNKGRPAGRG